VNHVVRNGDAPPGEDRRHDPAAHVVVRGQDPGRHAAAAPREQVGSQIGEGVELAITPEDHLPAEPLEGIDGVLKLEERRLLSHEELHVVDHEQVRTSARPPEAWQAAAMESLEERGRELLGRQADRRRGRVHVPHPFAGPLEQVRLAHAARTVDHQRAHFARTGDRHLDRAAGHAVAGADDEILEPMGHAAAGRRGRPRPRFLRRRAPTATAPRPLRRSRLTPPPTSG